MLRLLSIFSLSSVFFMGGCAGCGVTVDLDAGHDSGVDGGSAELDAGMLDTGTPDNGDDSGMRLDAGLPDSGSPDSGNADAGLVDAGPADAGPADAGSSDAGALDAGTSDAGQESTELNVELIWSPSIDLDLLVTKRDSLGRFCAATDPFISLVFDSEHLEVCSMAEDAAGMCGYMNCLPGLATLKPDWDATGFVSDGDPTLSNNEVPPQSGPETIVVDDVGAGEYLVSVDRDSSSTATFTVTAKMSVRGKPFEFFATRTAADPDTFDLGIIHVFADGGVCFDDLSGAEDCSQ